MFGLWFGKLLDVLNINVPMSKRVIERQLIGGILEMMNDQKLFYKNAYGRNHEYSDWTDEGRAALTSFVVEYSRKLLVEQEAELNERARALTWQTLKKEESK